MGFSPSKPQPTDWPSIAAVAGHATRPRSSLPPAWCCPAIVHSTWAGHPRPVRRADGPAARPVVHRGVAVRAARCPALQYEFDHQQRPLPAKRRRNGSAAEPARCRMRGRPRSVRQPRVPASACSTAAARPRPGRRRRSVRLVPPARRLAADPQYVREAFDVTEPTPSPTDTAGTPSATRY